MTKLNFKVDNYTVVLSLAVVVYALACVYSEGYFHPDEHFQILEFANYKMGNIPSQKLPWEFSSMIRPSLQPWIAYIMMKVLSIGNHFNPHMISLCMRVLTASLAIFSINRFIKAHKWQILSQNMLFFYIASYLLWFLPFVNVRFSSETWSGIFFMLAIGTLKNRKVTELDVLKIGAFCGIAFLLRYQTAFLFVGLLGWLGVVEKINLRAIIIMIGAFLSAMSIGVLLDFLFYDQWILTAWNYFEINILQDVASNFGTIPWLKFLLMIVIYMISPIAIIIIVSYLSMCIFRPRSIYVWSTILFLFVHLAIPHKEFRFFFPIVNLLPIILVIGYQQLTINLNIKNKISHRYVFKTIILVITSINLIALVASISTSPSYGRISVINFIDRKLIGRDIHLYTIRVQEQNPYVPYSFLHQSFYLNRRIKNIFLNDYSNLESIKFKSASSSLFIVRRFELELSNINSRLIKLGFREVYQSTPCWIAKLRGIILPNNIENAGDYILYERRLSVR